MTIAVATDHAGFSLAQELITFLTERGDTVINCGAQDFDENDDYPDIIKVAAEHIANGTADRAIILGGSGQGEAMVANRFKGVRATTYYGGNLSVVTVSREHNDANVLSLGARFLSKEDAQNAIESFLSTPFSENERHIRRIKKIDQNNG